MYTGIAALMVFLGYVAVIAMVALMIESVRRSHFPPEPLSATTIRPQWRYGEPVSLVCFLSSEKNVSSFDLAAWRSESVLVMEEHDLVFNHSMSVERSLEISTVQAASNPPTQRLLRELTTKGTDVFLHCVLYRIQPDGYKEQTAAELRQTISSSMFRNGHAVSVSVPLVTRGRPPTSYHQRYLLDDLHIFERPQTTDDDWERFRTPVNAKLPLWQQEVTIVIMDDQTQYSSQYLPLTHYPHVQQSSEGLMYRPFLHASDLVLLMGTKSPVNGSTTSVPLKLNVRSQYDLTAALIKQRSLRAAYIPEIKMDPTALERMFAVLYLPKDMLMVIIYGVIALNTMSILRLLSIYADYRFFVTRSTAVGLSLTFVSFELFATLMTFLNAILTQSGGVCYALLVGGYLWRYHYRTIRRLRSDERGLSEEAKSLLLKTREMDSLSARITVPLYMVSLAVYGFSSLALEKHESWLQWIVQSIVDHHKRAAFITILPAALVVHGTKCSAGIADESLFICFLKTVVEHTLLLFIPGEDSHVQPSQLVSDYLSILILFVLRVMYANSWRQSDTTKPKQD